MGRSLVSLDVLIVDCQAGGATPAHGDLLELGWATTNGAESVVPAEASWIRPSSDRRVSRVVRELTGWSEAALETSIEASEAWTRLRAVSVVSGTTAIPTVIHFARFELGFLRHLHAASLARDEPFPLDVICLHAIASRLFPELPRKNLRALAGHLGASPELVRRARGHVEVTAIAWRAIVPRLAALGIATWEELTAWLAAPAPARSRSTKRVFPLPSARRRTLPEVPGVYRFLRPNGDVLYVGKATNLKRRVASHFTTGSRATERSLEMLSQAHDIDVTTTKTTLEAALLETDEIKRLDPPYNVHLRSADRFAWFASRDWGETAAAPDDVHDVGPLPSRFAIAGLGAMRALLEAEPPTDRLRAASVGVPAAFAPPAALFDPAWNAFVAEVLAPSGTARRRLLEASARTVETERAEDEEAPEGWDAPTIRRYLERTLVNQGGLLRRSRVLALLADSRIEFREPDGEPRRLVIEDGLLVAITSIDEPAPAPSFAPRSRRARLASFDASRYDRLRVLATELRRVAVQGGDVEIRIGLHRVRGAVSLHRGDDRGAEGAGLDAVGDVAAMRVEDSA